MKETETLPVCLNCGASVPGKFCSACGQPIDTARFQLMHIFKQDFLKKVFYYDKGLLHWIRQLFTRPGQAVREYIDGKRANQLHYFSMFVIVILLFKIVENATPFHYADLTSSNKEGVDFFEGWLKHNAKIFYVSLIPFYALATYLLFRKAHLNYAEHFVINTFRSAASLMITTLFLVIVSWVEDSSARVSINQVTIFLLLAYGIWFYYQFFAPYYKRKIVVLILAIISLAVPVLLLTMGLAVYLQYRFHA